MKREAVNHTKMKRLCRRMDIPLWQAIGLLESLWLVTGRETPRGDIGKLSDEDIALAIDYRGDESTMIESLIIAGWIDRDETERLVIHDWCDHADDAVHMRLARTNQYFVGGKPPKLSRLAGKERDRAHDFYTACAQKATSSALPEPEPVTRACNQSQSQQPDPEPCAAAQPPPPAEKAVTAPVPINQSKWKSDPDYQRFVAAAGPAWGNLIDSDFEQCYHAWRKLDSGQKTECLRGIGARVEAKMAFQFIPKPANFLRTKEYERPVNAKARDSPSKSRAERDADAALEQFERLSRERENGPGIPANR